MSRIISSGRNYFVYPPSARRSLLQAATNSYCMPSLRGDSGGDAVGVIAALPDRPYQ